MQRGAERSRGCAADRALAAGQKDAGQLRARAVQDGHVADPVHEHACGAPGELIEERIARLPVPARRLDLDQLVIGQRAGGLLRQAFREPGVADLDEGLERMGQAAQVAALALGELGRGGGRVGAGGRFALLTHIVNSVEARQPSFPQPTLRQMSRQPHKTNRRSRSSGRWLREHFADPFVQRAQAQGWRSRAVFKLEEIDQRERLLRPGDRCVDLGAAPGAWSQYARRRVGPAGAVLASDLLPMDGLTGVEFIQGDFREEAVLAQILARLTGHQADVVLSDMAPSFSGVDAVDQPRAMLLSELALDLAAQVLKPGGRALIKTFQGAGFQELVKTARQRFVKVKLVKPAASRSRSPEVYLLAMDYLLV